MADEIEQKILNIKNGLMQVCDLEPMALSFSTMEPNHSSMIFDSAMASNEIKSLIRPNSHLNLSLPDRSSTSSIGSTVEYRLSNNLYPTPFNGPDDFVNHDESLKNYFGVLTKNIDSLKTCLSRNQTNELDHRGLKI